MIMTAIKLDDTHIFKAERRMGAQKIPLILLSSTILEPDLAAHDANTIRDALAVRYLDNPVTSEWAEALAQAEMESRAKVHSDGHHPGARLRMVFADYGVAQVGLVLLKVEAKTIRFREGGRA